MLKVIAMLALSAFTAGFSSFASCREQQNDKSVAENRKNDSTILKVLAEGQTSSITDPFVAVIRDEETYAKLRKMEPSLPKLEPEVFQLNTLVAAFLGTRNTGGFSVEITHGRNGHIRVSEKAPPKDAMTVQMLTSPFKLVSFAPDGSTAVELTVDEIFRQRAQLYRISSGTFNISGGFTGRTESFQLNGKLQLTRLGDLITIGFALVSSGGSRERSLRGAATGFIKDGALVINRMSHGSLIDPPSGELQVNGKFLEKSRLALQLASLPMNVPESYGGGGSIEAELVGASGN
ncbi:MAG TPA: protease complex subunit PrcB family protein [Pyrinomonadaceae bacterium]|nr:protease complex subunit PrcB family protein [Pyrinomonadaceae bacterium]